MQQPSYPLHRAVWRGEALHLDATSAAHVNERDLRGNTPLHIAAHFGDLAAVQTLLQAGARCAESRAGVRPVDEAVASGFRQVAAVLLRTDMEQKCAEFRALWPQRQAALEQQPDCHWEMTWDIDLMHFHVGGFLAPNDTYRVYKRGSFVRADYTLLGFKLRPDRANLSVLLRDGQLYAINHDARTVQCLTTIPQVRVRAAAGYLTLSQLHRTLTLWTARCKLPLITFWRTMCVLTARMAGPTPRFGPTACWLGHRTDTSSADCTAVQERTHVDHWARGGRAGWRVRLQRLPHCGRAV